MDSPQQILKQRFKTLRGTGCIVFRNHVAKSGGYPTIKIKGTTFRYHRVLWERVNGPIPKGMILRHTCDNPACSNLHHLLLGTHKDNVADRVQRDRSAKGERNGRAKLNEQQVKEILQSAGSFSSIGKRFNVNHKVIANIKRGLTWKHLQTVSV